MYSVSVQPMAEMVVEIQVIDTTFLAVKKNMHRPFSVYRGDFWADVVSQLEDVKAKSIKIP